MKGATEETSKKIGKDIGRYLEQAGFSNIKMELWFLSRWNMTH